MLRWQLQEGLSSIPKSTTESRIVENGDVFDFSLSDDEMATMRALDRNDRIGPHPDHIDF